jgi:hypothetical protein
VAQPAQTEAVASKTTVIQVPRISGDHAPLAAGWQTQHRAAPGCGVRGTAFAARPPHLPPGPKTASPDSPCSGAGHAGGRWPPHLPAGPPQPPKAGPAPPLREVPVRAPLGPPGPYFPYFGARPSKVLGPELALCACFCVCLIGGRTRARTWDPLIKSQRLKMLGIGPNQQ